MLGDADAVGAGRVHHHDAARRRGCDVDVVDAGAGAGNYPKARRVRDHCRINRGGAADDQRVSLGEIASQLRCRSLCACVDGPSRNAAKNLDGGGWQLIGDDDVHGCQYYKYNVAFLRARETSPVPAVLRGKVTAVCRAP